MSVINPGELKDVLAVLGVVEGAVDENGFPTETVQELFKLRCKKKTISTKEFVAADRATSRLTYKFICRNRNIDNAMLIEYKGKTFNIAHVHEIDELFVEITATEQEV